jgi:hypothetical protein
MMPGTVISRLACRQSRAATGTAHESGAASGLRLTSGILPTWYPDISRHIPSYAVIWRYRVVYQGICVQYGIPAESVQITFWTAGKWSEQCMNSKTIYSGCDTFQTGLPAWLATCQSRYRDDRTASSLQLYSRHVRARTSELTSRKNWSENIWPVCSHSSFFDQLTKLEGVHSWPSWVPHRFLIQLTHPEERCDKGTGYATW